MNTGEMLKEIPKASHDRGNQYKEANYPRSELAKTEKVKELGFTNNIKKG